MGDKLVDGNMTVIYTPKDNYYRSADDKIIEIALINRKESIRVITDDIEIREKIEKINLDENLDIELERASDFAMRLKKYVEKEDEIDNKEGISDDEVNDINNELLDIWKN